MFDIPNVWFTYMFLTNYMLFGSSLDPTYDIDPFVILLRITHIEMFTHLLFAITMHLCPLLGPSYTHLLGTGH